MLLKVASTQSESKLQAKKTEDHLIPLCHDPHDVNHDGDQHKKEDMEIYPNQERTPGTYEKRNVGHPQKHGWAGTAAEHDIFIHDRKSAIASAGAGV